MTVLSEENDEISLRPIRAAVAVATHGAICRAASHLHRSAPATTRAILEIEAKLGVELFDRSRQGLRVTDDGQIAIRRFQCTLEQLRLAELEVNAGSMLAHKVTHRHLRTIVAVMEEGSETAAARRLHVSQPAVTRTLRDIENIVGRALFFRTTRGMIATSPGELLYKRAKLSLAEIRALMEDLANRRGSLVGRVVVGVLPLCATLLVPRAITRLLVSYPEVKVRVIEGRYEPLRAALIRGDVDVVVGALRPFSAELRQEVLFIDNLVVISRPGHPVLDKPASLLRNLANAQWVIPAEATPARDRFDQMFHDIGLDVPPRAIESGSLATVRALLLESDRISVASPHQVYYELQHGLLTAHAIELGNTDRHIGFAVRSNFRPTHAVERFMEEIRAVSHQLTDGQPQPNQPRTS